ncbi:hypothetical protein [Aurantimonas sp. VKM B-3413]|uniref:hypothetical protein n=1 Tax=Aurantimonas sp. VKM B-3413 TaxID=2779401 RepID=UPI001E59AE30|nr:hypothetical protein [Aurantimonas sp. VKM B-3413]MCB8836644.1 hypothetical protein [Aurantimonas sp. VKM B-3413]
MLQSIFTQRPGENALPARSASVGGWLRTFTEEWRRQRLRRQAFSTLLRVDNDILRDVTGLDRSQIEAIANMPLEKDALEALRSLERAEHGEVKKSGRLLAFRR